MKNIPKMNTIQGFTRQETISLTGLKSGKLSYYDEISLVVPEKHGNPKRPKVFYSAEQVLQLKIAQKLRDRLSLRQIEEAIDYLKSRKYEASLFDCKLVFVGDKIHVIDDWEEFGLLVLGESAKNNGKVSVCDLDQIGDVTGEMTIAAKKEFVPDFFKRFAQCGFIENVQR